MQMNTYTYTYTHTHTLTLVNYNVLYVCKMNSWENGHRRKSHALRFSGGVWENFTCKQQQKQQNQRRHIHRSCRYSERLRGRENWQYNGLAECSRKSLGCANIDVFTASKVIDRLSSWPFYRAKQQIILDTYIHTYIYVCGHILTKFYASNVTEGDHSVATCLAFGSGSQDKT